VKPIEHNPEVLQGIQSLIQTVLKDISDCQDSVESRDGPLARRTLVRTLFAGIEGVVWALKTTALEHHRMGWVVFSQGELALLSEKTFDLDDKGQLLEKSARISLAKNIRFAFRSFAKAESVEFEIAVGEDGWELLRRAIRIRDRLMHPKNMIDLEITDKELQLIDQATSWWGGQLSKMLKTVMASGESKRRGAPFPHVAT
jgi:hypothetical protein